MLKKIMLLILSLLAANLYANKTLTEDPVSEKEKYINFRNKINLISNLSGDSFKKELKKFLYDYDTSSIEELKWAADDLAEEKALTQFGFEKHPFPPSMIAGELREKKEKFNEKYLLAKQKSVKFIRDSKLKTSGDIQKEAIQSVKRSYYKAEHNYRMKKRVKYSRWITEAGLVHRINKKYFSPSLFELLPLSKTQMNILRALKISNSIVLNSLKIGKWVAAPATGGTSLIIFPIISASYRCASETVKTTTLGHPLKKRVANILGRGLITGIHATPFVGDALSIYNISVKTVFDASSIYYISKEKKLKKKWNHPHYMNMLNMGSPYALNFIGRRLEYFYTIKNILMKDFENEENRKNIDKMNESIKVLQLYANRTLSLYAFKMVKQYVDPKNREILKDVLSIEMKRNLIEGLDFYKNILEESLQMDDTLDQTCEVSPSEDRVKQFFSRCFKKLH